MACHQQLLKLQLNIFPKKGPLLMNRIVDEGVFKASCHTLPYFG